MTTRQMEALNRKMRIIKAARAGELYRVIAEREGVTGRHVSFIAIQAGIRRMGDNLEAVRPADKGGEECEA